MPKPKTALIFHGFPSPPSAHAAIIQFLEQNHYQIVMPDWLKLSKTELEETITNIDVDLIIGISLGGLLAIPYAAKKPQAKLVLIAAGPYLETKIPLYNVLLKLPEPEQNLELIRRVKKIDLKTYWPIYKFFNWQKNISDAQYQQRASDNLQALQKITNQELLTALKLVRSCNHTSSLKELRNPTLIFAGQNDQIMPANLSKKMQRLIVDSQLIVSDRVHHDVFSGSDWPSLKKFLAIAC